MKHSLLYPAVAAAMLSFAPAMADTPAAGTTIATVNIQIIMRDSVAAQSVRDQLQKKQESFKADIAKKQDDLQKEDQDLQKENADLEKQRTVLSKSAFEEKAAAFEKKVTKFRTKANDVKKEVDAKEALLTSASVGAQDTIQKTVTDIIADLAKEKGFALSIPTSQTLYADSKLDITDEVLKRLNQKLPKLDAKFDSSATAKPDKE